MIYECLTCGESFTLKAEATRHAKKHNGVFIEFRKASKGIYLDDKYYVYNEKKVEKRFEAVVSSMGRKRIINVPSLQKGFVVGSKVIVKPIKQGGEKKK